MKLHPLLNPKSPHYGSGKNASVYRMYKDNTLEHFQGWCNLNCQKYKERCGKKVGEDIEDNEEKRRSFYFTYLLADFSQCFNNEIAFNILSGDITEEELKEEYQALKNKASHTAEELILLMILDYMSRD